MPRRYEEHQVYKRYANGMCVTDRICRRCGREYIGPRNICPKCRNEVWRKEGKFNKQYHRNYYHKHLSKKVIQAKNRSRRQPRDPQGRKQKAYDRNKQRIRAEIRAIRKAGLDPDNDSIQTILDAGVNLSDFPRRESDSNHE